MSIQIRRGDKANLPASASDGQPLFVEDTGELYMGTGAGVVPVKIDNSNVIGGGQVVLALTCGMNISAFQVVAVRGDGLAYVADAAAVADADRVIGMAITSATAGNPVSVQQAGKIDNVGWSFTPGKTVYLGLSGAPTESLNVGAFQLPVGVALSASNLEVAIGLPIIFA